LFFKEKDGEPVGYDICNFCSNRLCTNQTETETQTVGKSCGFSDGYNEWSKGGELGTLQYRYCNSECWCSNRDNEKVEVEAWKSNVKKAE
jgi:hypothetical protein